MGFRLGLDKTVEYVLLNWAYTAFLAQVHELESVK